MSASQEFRAAVERWDLDAIGPLLAPDIVFHSPVTHKAFHGRDAVQALLRHVGATFEDFRYTDELVDGDLHVLVFAARVGDRDLQGIDLLRVGDDGLIGELTVMIRPLSGLIPFAQAMAERVAGAG